MVQAAGSTDSGRPLDDAVPMAYLLPFPTNWEQLPVNARLYLQRIKQVTGVPIDMISTSPDRDHTIMMRHPYLPD